MDNRQRLENYKQRLEEYYKCEASILKGQEYSLGGRTMKRADLGKVTEMIQYLEKSISNLEAKISGKSKRTMRIMPRDV